MSMIFTPPGLFSQTMYGSGQTQLVEAAFVRFLNVELDGSRMNAGKIGEIATQVTRAISDHYETFSSALPVPEKENVERIAKASGIDVKPATIEYLSNAYLFRAIRDYFDLPNKDRFPRFDIGGFLVFTMNGSIVASPAEDSSDRTFHYTRMPSRKTECETSSRNGRLKDDIAVGHGLKSTAYATSAIRRLLYVPAQKADLFEAVHRSVTSASLSVSRFVTRGG